MPPEAAWPVSATFSTSTSVLTVNFGHLLIDGTSALGNWRYFDGVNQWNQAAPLPINMRTISGPHNIGVPDATPPSCSYAAVPPDVIDRNGLPVVAFSGFPVTVIA